MNVAFRKPMSADEFLTWERDQKLRWEFDGVRPVAITGGSNAHSTIQGNLVTALFSRLRGKPCRPHGGSLKLKIGHHVRYPDAFVTCDPAPNDADMAESAVVIFEVLSKSTQRVDRTTKLMEYRTLTSLRRYVLVEQDQAMLTTYTHTENGWVVDQLLTGQTLNLPEIGIEIPVAELYADLTLPDVDD